jgi:hypothetical protein
MGRGLYRRWQKLLLADQWKKQRGICPICTYPLPEYLAVLDRYDRRGNFAAGNIRALHADCVVLVARRRAAGQAAHAMMEAAE